MAFQPASGLRTAPATVYGRPVQATPAADPFAPIDIHAWIRNNLGAVPPVLTLEQARAGAQASIGQTVHDYTATSQGQARQGEAAVEGYAGSLAKGLAQTAPQNVHNAYAPAEAALAATNNALADRVSGAGNQAADDLAGRLASINSPNVTDPAVAGLRQSAAGAGNATYATGNASLDQMIAEHASAADYAGKLPAFAQLAGIQQAGMVQGAAAKALADKLAPVYGQLPTLTQNALTQNQGRRDAYQGRADSASLALQGQNTSLAAVRAGLETAGVKAAAKAATPPRVSVQLSSANKFLTDVYGNPITRPDGNPIPYTPYVKPTAPKGPKDTSAADAKARASALKDARNTALSIVQDNRTKHTVYSTQPKVDQFGTVVKDTRTGKPLLQRTAVGDKPSGSYYSAIHQIESAIKDELISVGMTDYDVTRYAQTIANSYWKPGQGGRPGAG